MEIKIITIDFYHNTILDYPVIWDILDLVNLKPLFVLRVVQFVVIYFGKLWTFFIYRKLICKLNLSNTLESGMKHVLSLSICITNSICFAQLKLLEP